MGQEQKESTKVSAGDVIGLVSLVATSHVAAVAPFLRRGFGSEAFHPYAPIAFFVMLAMTHGRWSNGMGAYMVAWAAARHGDEALLAVRKVGPKALTLAEEAGEHAPSALKLLSRHGEEAAIWVVKRPKGLDLVARYGDDAAGALIKHRGLAEPVIERVGKPAVNAMLAVGPQGGRRMAMMAEGGELAAIGRTPELMDVIARHGDRAMDFVWRNKAPLAAGAALTAFIANPEPYLDGTNKLATTVAREVVRPVVREAGDTISHAMWTLLGVSAGLLSALTLLAIRHPKLASGLVKLAGAACARKG